MNTTENNKLIAEFMGIVFTKDNKANHPRIKATYPPIECFKYHSSWDWLMECVEKIESLKLDKVSFGLIIEKNSVTIYYCHETEPKKRVDLFFEWGQKTKIGNTYKIVCSFIEWYNKQK